MDDTLRDLFDNLDEANEELRGLTNRLDQSCFGLYEEALDRPNVDMTGGFNEAIGRVDEVLNCALMIRAMLTDLQTELR